MLALKTTRMALTWEFVSMRLYEAPPHSDGLCRRPDGSINVTAYKAPINLDGLHGRQCNCTKPLPTLKDLRTNKPGSKLAESVLVCKAPTHPDGLYGRVYQAVRQQCQCDSTKSPIQPG